MMERTVGTPSEEAPATEAPSGASEPSRLRQAFTWAGWSLFAVMALVFFTLFKLPEVKLKNYIQGMIASQLADRGVTFAAKETSLSFGFGITYSMEDVTLNPPPPKAPAHLDRIEVSPSLLSMVLGRIGGKFKLYQDEGSLKGSFSMKGTETSVSFESDQFNLGRAGLISLATPVELSGILSGGGSVSGDFSDPKTVNGNLEIDLRKIVFNQQKVAGFSIPQLSISEGKAVVSLEEGKARIQSLLLGKPGSPTDDITANITGDITLAKRIESSPLNLKAKFSLSQAILKSFVLIDALLGAGKQGDGSYAYNLTGTLTSPIPAPIKNAQ